MYADRVESIISIHTYINPVTMESSSYGGIIPEYLIPIGDDSGDHHPEQVTVVVYIYIYCQHDLCHIQARRQSF